MLTFIRKTKNTLLMEGRFVKYMLYGTGEVLLVAIGILLAFSVDNSCVKDFSEEYDGTSWTEVANLNTAREHAAGSGTQPAALCFGGGPGGTPYIASTEKWDGTSWTEVNDLNTARPYLSAAGSNTAALAIGGGAYPPIIANTESWDGTSWTEVAALGTATADGGGCGTQTAGLAFGGAPGNQVITQEWTDPSYTIKTVTVS